MAFNPLFNFTDWLNSPGLFRTVLVEISYRLQGVAKKLYVSNAAYISSGTDTPAYQAYDALVVGELSFDRQLSEVFTGASRYQLSTIELLPFEQVNDLLTSATTNQQIRILLGDKDQPLTDFSVIVDALISDVLPKDDRVVVKIKDKAKALAVPYLTSYYNAGVAKDTLKPCCLGRCFNMSPVLIDDFNHVYQFNNAPSQAVTAVRFNGALVNAINYVVDLTLSTITFSIKPQGVVTCDVDGTVNATTWLQTASELLSYIAPGANITGLPNYLLGLYIKSERTVSSLLDELCASVGGYWFYDRTGLLIVKQFNGTSNTNGANKDFDLTEEQNLLLSRSPQRKIVPVAQMSLQYQRNFTPLQNVAAVVFDTNLALAQQLQQVASKVQQLNTVTKTNYPASLVLDNVASLLVNQIDAVTEINRRLTLRNKPRFIYQTEQLAGALQFKLGDELYLETAGLNGVEALVTRLNENISTGITKVEFWQ
ncbi:MAG: hypothetical protein JKY55_09820 [Aliivibrio sp.]|uniref:hypothetical protein n=1 Tax=Aliivibrio sp. TaxID=1872443 RepID=UPI001A51BAA6|nr:hypothetical protein [Aliivibrio sp.]